VSNVYNFPGQTYTDIDPKEMLENVIENIQFEQVVVVGWTDDTKLTLCSSMGQTAEIVYALEMAKKAVMDASEL
jgi:hypothetical protein